MTSATFDLVLLDVELPRMNGVEFLSWALSRQPDLAVIMLTGCAEPELAMKCIDQGALEPRRLGALARTLVARGLPAGNLSVGLRPGAASSVSFVLRVGPPET